MIRRAFLKLACSASVAALVSLESFRSTVIASIPEPEPVPEREEVSLYSPVLQALRDWNDFRLQRIAAGSQESEFWDPPQIAPRYAHIAARSNVTAPRAGGFFKADPIEAGFSSPESWYEGLDDIGKKHYAKKVVHG